MNTQDHLPIYGVGPYYGIGVITTALTGILLSLLGFLNRGAIHNSAAAWSFTALGLATSILGARIWASAALGRSAIDHYIKSNTLCTEGVYRYVRNPCYSGIALFFTGLLLLCRNRWLLILPPVYWLAMTVLMKATEEKWLAEKYGEPYRDYCRQVNRCIPWFPRKQ